MTDVQADLEQSREALLARVVRPGPSPALRLDAATPLSTLPPDIVALIVGRVRAGVAALGPRHPRQAIVPRVIVPSVVLAVLDLVGLVVALAAGHVLLAVVAALLFAVLAYLAVAGVRFVRQDPLRVSAEVTATVETAKQWRTSSGWDATLLDGPWARLVGAAIHATARVSAGLPWTWGSIAPQRARLDLAATLGRIDAAAWELAVAGAPFPSSEPVVVRVAALTLYADRLDAVAASPEDLSSVLPPEVDRDLYVLLETVLDDGTS